VSGKFFRWLVRPIASIMSVRRSTSIWRNVSRSIPGGMSSASRPNSLNRSRFQREIVM
jgi:hypothetical protein